jgi:hypothetical protein
MSHMPHKLRLDSCFCLNEGEGNFIKSSEEQVKMSHLICEVKCRIIDNGWGCGVHKSMDVVVKVCQHVIHSEGRCYDTVYNDVLFLRDYGVQSLALHGLYSGDHVFA